MMKKIKFLIVALLMGMVVFRGSEVLGQQKTLRIARLDIEGTDERKKELIKLNSGLGEGTEQSWEDIQRAIKKLWSLNIFSDIQVFEDSSSSEGIYLRFKVTEYPRLERVDVFGNEKIKRKKIDEKLDLYRGAVISPLKVKRAQEKLRKYYIEEGFLNAEITTQETALKDTNRVVVAFYINENKKVQVKKIRFFGNSELSDKKLRKQMKETKEDTWWRGADFKPDKYPEDKEKVLEYFRKNGFRDAEILRDSLYYDSERENMFIDIYVLEGTKYYFGGASFEGNELFTDSQLLSFIEFEEGDVYDEEEFEKSFQNLQKGYWDQGHLYAQINPLQKTFSKDTITTQYYIMEGNPVKINEVIIEGNTKTKEHVIRREIFTKPGDTFSSAVLERSQRNVWILNYFSNVEPNVSPRPDLGDYADIIFTVEEKSTDTANMSAGYSQRDGLIGALGVSMNNFFGNGQRVSIDWQFGRIYRSFSINFVEPWLMGTPTLVGVSLFDTKRGGYWYGFDWRNRGASIRFGRRFHWPDDYFRGDWVFSVSQNKISNISPGLNLDARFIGRTSNAMSITQIISRDSRDRPEFPTSGMVFSLTTMYSGGILGGDQDFHKHEIQLERYNPLFWKFVLYDNIEMGFMKGFAPDSYIPPLDRFYMGGTALTLGTSLRGYDERAVGALSSDGYPMGGKSLIKYTAEIRFPIVSNPTVYGLLFAEAGNVWENIQYTMPFDLKRSIGFGGRVYMPLVGMLGLDIGYGFDYIDRSTGKKGKWKTHFQFGQTF